MIELPLASDGARTVSVNVGDGVYTFRTYWLPGRWLMDIANSIGDPLACGVVLVPGINNLLRGHGAAFDGVRLVAALSQGDAGDPDNLGVGLKVYWQTDATDIYPLGDPLVD